jgi:hypothetical protein
LDYPYILNKNEKEGQKLKIGLLLGMSTNGGGMGTKRVYVVDVFCIHI